MLRTRRCSWPLAQRTLNQRLALRRGRCPSSDPLRLLIAPDDLARAEEVLVLLGYRRYWDHRRMPSWWREHAGEWLRDHDRVVLDVHRTLPGVGVDARGGLAGVLA